jgi:D-amino-acid dehydrogenase
MIEKGCWVLYKTEKFGDHEKHLAEQAAGFGLKAKICNANEVQSLETETEVDVAGGVLYLDDCHLNAARFMETLHRNLLNAGVRFLTQTEVNSFEKKNGGIAAVITTNGKVGCDEVLIANGSWMGKTSKLLGLRVPLQPGKGYSMVFDNLKKNLQYPSILIEARTATTPINDWLRIGGTMELSGHNDKILPKRVMAIYNAFKKYYPSMNLPEPDPSKAWFGYRPVSPDGMPYIGKHQRYRNLLYAGGHAMLGLSAAAGTGLLIKEIVNREQPSIELRAFDPSRFS